MLSVLHNFYLFNTRRQFQAKLQLHSVFWRQIRATGELRTLFCRSFSFLTITANLKQNDSCAVWFAANFKQEQSCARRFVQLLAKKANQSSLEIIDHTNQFT